MSHYREQFDVAAGSTAIRMAFNGEAQYITGIGGAELSPDNNASPDTAVKLDTPIV